MLAIRPNCENCGKDLAPEATDAMICTYECTFCTDCVVNVLKNVCPNCGGGFEKRPIRPKAQLVKHPASRERVYKPVVIAKYKPMQERLKKIPPEQR